MLLAESTRLLSLLFYSEEYSSLDTKCYNII